MENIFTGVYVDSFTDFAKSFTLAYSLCYLVSPFMGLYSPLIGFYPSAIFLISVGVGLICGVSYQNRYLLGILAVGEAMACVGHYLQIIPWSPTFSNTAYIVMAVLDLIQSLCLIKILRNIYLGEKRPSARYKKSPLN